MSRPTLPPDPIPPATPSAVSKMAPLGPPPPIRACLFDMDGLLLDTEDLYSAAVNTVLAEHGRPPIPWAIKAQLQGRPGPQASHIFMQWAQLPVTHEAFLARQAQEQRKLFPGCKALPGVEALLPGLTKRGVEIALATSSHAGNYRIKTDHLPGLMGQFPEECRVLGDDPRIPKGRGKPCPDIYLLALECVNQRLRKAGREEKEITPAECLVFEDSVPGVEAGRRAGMQVIWVPMEGLAGVYKGREKEVLAGRSGMVYSDTTVRDGEKDDMAGPPPGELDDGWGRMVMSLEDFDYESYGIKA